MFCGYWLVSSSTRSIDKAECPLRARATVPAMHLAACLHNHLCYNVHVAPQSKLLIMTLLTGFYFSVVRRSTQALLLFGESTMFSPCLNGGRDSTFLAVRFVYTRGHFVCSYVVYYRTWIVRCMRQSSLFIPYACLLACMFMPDSAHASGSTSCTVRHAMLRCYIQCMSLSARDYDTISSWGSALHCCLRQSIVLNSQLELTNNERYIVVQY